jgi:hypothetical protein
MEIRVVKVTKPKAMPKADVMIIQALWSSSEMVAKGA